MSAAGSEPAAVTTELDAGALPLAGVLMQALSHIAPAVGMIFAVQAITASAGLASPFAPGDNRWAPIVFLVWAAAGLVMMWVSSRSPKASWLAKAGEAAGEEAVLDGELLHSATPVAGR
jgi:hypothetical protein